MRVMPPPVPRGVDGVGHTRARDRTELPDLGLADMLAVRDDFRNWMISRAWRSACSISARSRRRPSCTRPWRDTRLPFTGTAFGRTRSTCRARRQDNAPTFTPTTGTCWCSVSSPARRGGDLDAHCSRRSSKKHGGTGCPAISKPRSRRTSSSTSTAGSEYFATSSTRAAACGCGRSGWISAARLVRGGAPPLRLRSR